MIDLDRGRYWDEAWNPVTGCSPVGAVCERCWARALVRRAPKLHGPGPFEHPRLHDDRLSAPSRRRKPTVFAVCWLGDLFHERVPDAWIQRALDAISSTAAVRSHGHTYLVLTKRRHRLVDWGNRLRAAQALVPGLWIGVSAWDGVSLAGATSALAAAGVQRTWLSVEPLITDPGPQDEIAQALESTVGQVVLGGETGPGGRTMQPSWVRRIRDACRTAGVSFFFKGWGARCPRAELRESLRELPLDETYDPVALVLTPRGLRTIDGETHDDLAWHRTCRSCAHVIFDTTTHVAFCNTCENHRNWHPKENS